MNKIRADCIIVAAGMGKRLGLKIPKAFVKIEGMYLFEYSFITFFNHPLIKKVILVVPVSKTNFTFNYLLRKFSYIEKTKLLKKVFVVSGGEHRWQSVKNGLNLADSDFVIVHDSARPFVTNKIINNVLTFGLKYDCVITAIPIADTVKKIKDGKVIQTIDRNKLVRVQTPQLFNRLLLQNVLAKVNKHSFPPTDEAYLMEKAKILVGITSGDDFNFKITTKKDLLLAKMLIKERILYKNL